MNEGKVSQVIGIDPALENAMMPGMICGLDHKDTEDRAMNLMERVGLKDRIGHKIGELSGGEQQRVALARAIIMEPALLLADEPTANLDQGNGRKIMDMLHSLAKKQNKCIIVATHDTRILNTFDRILFMEDGIVKERLKRKT